jgi:hypothetical protein
MPMTTLHHRSRRRTLAFAVPLATTVASLVASPASASPAAWAIDDGEKIKQDATSLPLAQGTGNPVWSPGQPIRLFALKDETVAFQVVVSADATPLDGVTVDVDSLVGPGGATLANDATGPGVTDPTWFVGRRIERFVEHYFDVTRASGGDTSGESLGWARGSGPAPGAWTGLMPDALIPVEVAPAWEPYPMHVDANRNAVIWVDVTVPPDQPSGAYTSNVHVASAGGALSTLPLEIDVLGATMPDRPIQTMLYYDRGELDSRIGGGDAAEANLWKLYHRHRISPMHDAESAATVQAHLPALDGSEYTAANGYDGPGVGVGDGILSFGAYGSLGAPGAGPLATVQSMADVVAANALFPTTDVFVYAIDETCGSSYGATWKSLLAGSTDKNAAQVRVGWTCSDNPTTQPVDIPIVIASQYDPNQAKSAAAKGKDVWIYNGIRPETDAFFTDTSAIAPRANAWIAAMNGIARWFYWETTFWYDNNHGGHGPYDPFTTPETFHNADGDWSEGDGVLVYPGKQVDQFTDHSVGVNGVLPSIRLKNLRRGIEDAGYYQLAHAASAAKAEAIAAALLPKVLSSASDGSPVAWSEAGNPWFQARKALAQLVPQTPDPVDAGPAAPARDAGGAAPTDAGGAGSAPAGDGAASTGTGGAGGATGDAGTAGSGNPAAGGATASASPGGQGGCSLGTSGSGGAGEVALAGAALAIAAARRSRKRAVTLLTHRGAPRSTRNA